MDRSTAPTAQPHSRSAPARAIAIAAERPAARAGLRLFLLLSALTLLVLLIGALAAKPRQGLAERAITGAWAEAWQRAADSEDGFVHAFDPLRDEATGLLPASVSGPAGKPLVIGERITLVAPDGSVHLLRVCDPASASSAERADCLNAVVARAVPAPSAPVPQRNL